MNKLRILTLTALSLVLILGGCKKETVQPQIGVNELDGTLWKGPAGINWAEIIQFKGDSIFQYIDSVDLLLYSGCTKNKNTLTIKDNYTLYWGDKKFLNTPTYTVQYKISGDTLYFNGKFKGKKE